MLADHVKKVLVIDDSEVDRFIAERVMKKSGFADEIVTINGGQDSLAYLLSFDADPSGLPELIFLDIRMPEMDGFEFLDRFISLPENIIKNITVVMLSSSTHPDDQRRAKEISCVKGFIDKPISQDKLQQMMTG
ncbi:MAG: response regulator [Taibaiella sp.]|nr:response regulator [Taibaiella sp.]